LLRGCAAAVSLPSGLAENAIYKAHLGPAQGEKGLSEDEALQKARKMKADDLGINTAGCVVLNVWTLYTPACELDSLLTI
jgi:hypothetical protein